MISKQTTPIAFSDMSGPISFTSCGRFCYNGCANTTLLASWFIKLFI